MILTDAELLAIEIRVESTTPGPWYPILTDDELFMGATYVGLEQRGSQQNLLFVDEGRDQKRLIPKDMDENQVIAITCLQYPRLVCPDACDSNAIFIAHARDDVPALIAEVRRLRRLLGEIEESPGATP